MAVAAGRRGRALGVRRAVLLAVAVVATLGAACSGGGGDERSRRTEVTAPPTTTTTLSPEGEILAALDGFWKVLARAYYDLDPTGLDRVASGERLQVAVDEIATRKAEGRPMRLVVENDYEFVELTAERAVVRDRIINHSVRLDPVTREPTEAPPADEWDDLLTLELLEGTWKVVLERPASQG